MKSVRMLFLTCLMLSSVLTNAQDIIGKWMGHLVVHPNGITTKLPCIFTIESKRDGKYLGECLLLVKVDGVKYEIRTSIVGRLASSEFTFTDIEALKYTCPDRRKAFWCKKYGTLKVKLVKQNELMMKGMVYGNGSITNIKMYDSCMPAEGEFIKLP